MARRRLSRKPSLVRQNAFISYSYRLLGPAPDGYAPPPPAKTTPSSYAPPPPAKSSGQYAATQGAGNAATLRNDGMGPGYASTLRDMNMPQQGADEYFDTGYGFGSTFLLNINTWLTVFRHSLALPAHQLAATAAPASMGRTV